MQTQVLAQMCVEDSSFKYCRPVHAAQTQVSLSLRWGNGTFLNSLFLRWWNCEQRTQRFQDAVCFCWYWLFVCFFVCFVLTCLLLMIPSHHVVLNMVLSLPLCVIIVVGDSSALQNLQGLAALANLASNPGDLCVTSMIFVMLYSAVLLCQTSVGLQFTRNF